MFTIVECIRALGGVPVLGIWVTVRLWVRIGEIIRKEISMLFIRLWELDVSNTGLDHAEIERYRVDKRRDEVL